MVVRGLETRKAKNRDQHRLAGAMLLKTDYFTDEETNISKKFYHRSRMNKELFMRIVFGIMEYADNFTCKKDYTRLWWFSSVQKCMSALWCIAYGGPSDAQDDYLRISKRLRPHAYVVVEDAWMTSRA
jgi:hypothetical protein